MPRIIMRNIFKKIIDKFLSHPAWAGVSALIAVIALIYTIVSFHKDLDNNRQAGLQEEQIDVVKTTTVGCPKDGNWIFHGVRMSSGWRLCELKVENKQNQYLLSLSEGCNLNSATKNEFNIGSFYCVNEEGYLKYRNVDVIVNSSNAYLKMRPGGWTGHGKVE